MSFLGLLAIGAIATWIVLTSRGWKISFAPRTQLRFGLVFLAVGVLVMTWVKHLASDPGGYGMIAALVFFPVSLVPLFTGAALLFHVERPDAALDDARARLLQTIASGPRPDPGEAHEDREAPSAAAAARRFRARRTGDA